MKIPGTGRLERRPIVLRNAGLRIDRHIRLAQQIELRRKPCHHVNEGGGQTFLARSTCYHQCVSLYAADTTVPPRCNTSLFHPVREIRQHPRLDSLVERRPEVHQSDSRARAPQIQRSLCRRIPTAYHDNVLVESFMPLAIDVRHMRQILTRHSEIIRRAEVAGRDYDSLRSRRTPLAIALSRMHQKPVARPIDGRHPLVLTHGDLEMKDNRSIVRQRIAARWLLGCDDERNAAKRELFRGREKTHICWIVRNRAHHDLRLDHDDAQSGALSRNGGGETAWSSAYYQKVKLAVTPGHCALSTVCRSSYISSS